MLSAAEARSLLDAIGVGTVGRGSLARRRVRCSGRPVAIGSPANLTARGLSAQVAARMVKRRARQAGLPEEISPHSFRATGSRSRDRAGWRATTTPPSGSCARTGRRGVGHPPPTPQDRRRDSVRDGASVEFRTA